MTGTGQSRRDQMRKRDFMRSGRAFELSLCRRLGIPLAIAIFVSLSGSVSQALGQSAGAAAERILYLFR